ncbi:MAG: trypsin-like peptidase domain-containing protein, partial [Elusimicrobia bacterium]|nr:trypsin-like peptidase domain-containing protein [Elusimicrobiota bacterium]
MNCAKKFIKKSGLLLILVWAVPAQALNSALSQLQEGFSSVAAKAKPAVVNIQVIHEQRVQVPYEFYFGDPEDLFQEFFQGQPRKRETLRRFKGTGTGVIINADGYVLTNEHVVSDAGEIDVTLTKADGKQTTLPGKVVGTDPGLDLAVVKIQTGRDFPFLRLADSDKVKVGDWAVAIGSPFELQQTVTVGVISAVRQSLLIEGRNYANMLQTDAAINRGNSGGPLLNLEGDVIGINTAIYSPSGAFAGIGFSVPANEIREVLDQL